MTVSFAVMTPNGLTPMAPDPFRYPGGEWDMKNIAAIDGTYLATVRGSNMDDLAKAALFGEVAHQRQCPFALLVPYLPAARSDRPMDGRPVGANVYGSFIQSMNPQQIITIDPHSERAMMYYFKTAPLSLTPLVLRAVAEDRYHYVIAPDQGALDRAYKVAAALHAPVLQCTKHRDTATGKITHMSVPDLNPHHIGGRLNYLVVDDICDGGGTFMGLARQLELPKERLGLWVTHGIFSGRANELRTHYNDIYTTDSHPGHGRVGVATSIVPVAPYMWENIKKEFP